MNARQLLIVGGAVGAIGAGLAARKPAASFVADAHAGMRVREGQLRAQLARDTGLSPLAEGAEPGELADARAIEGR